MIPSRTLLVLGAGASRPYLFPTAKELTNLILERNENEELLVNMGFNTGPFYGRGQLIPAQPQNTLLHYHHWLETTLKMYGVDEDDLRQFQGRFRLSQAYSVDAFVADNPTFKHLASLMIAAILLRCERKERLEGDWYQLLFNELIDEHGKDFPADALSVVTFNYDRSLEMYLYQSFLSRFDLSSGDAWEAVRKIETVHVYGSLGSLYDADSIRRVEYGCDAIKAGAEGLHLVGPRTQSEHSQAIAAMIDRSPRIVFLGFGFDRLNLTQVRTPVSGKNVFATCKGLSVAGKARAENALQRPEPNVYTRPNVHKDWISWGNPDHNAAEFLHNSLAFA